MLKKRTRQNGNDNSWGRPAPRLTLVIDENGFIVDVKSPQREHQTALSKPIPERKCRVCGKNVRRDRLRSHMRNAHPHETDESPPFIKSGPEDTAEQSKFVQTSGTKTLDQKQQRFTTKTAQPNIQSRKSLQTGLSLNSKQTSPILTTPDTQDRFVICHHCYANVLPKNMPKHLRKVHGVTERKQNTKLPVVSSKLPIAGNALKRNMPLENVVGFEVCPECRERIRPDKLSEHRRKEHGVVLESYKNARIAKKKKNQQTGTIPKRQEKTDAIEEMFNQSFDERIDGSKHWGHLRREHGRFGSHPLFDDYDDESTA